MINHPHRKKTTKAAAAASPTRPRVQRAAPRVRPDHDRDYDLMLKRMKAAFEITTMGGVPLFTTDAADLYACYLDSLPAERDVHSCSACRRFIRTYGGLVRVDDEGFLIPVMWNDEIAGDVPAFYKPAFMGMRDRVRRAKITGVFKTALGIWGQPSNVAGDGATWRHMSVIAPTALMHDNRVLTAGQAMAAKLESFDTVRRALAEFPPAVLDQALRVLESGHLDRAEKFLGPARWLRALHELPLGRRGHNLFWKAIATAPEGYCHPRASVLAPLLADIEAGTSFEVLRARHAAKVESTQYQRPQAAPTAGNIASAEALVAKLGIERSLQRRFARLDELVAIWTTGPVPSHRSPSGGVFSHLAPKAAEPPGAPVAFPPSTMTWAKFARDVLPRAERVQLLVPVMSGRFLAFTTAVHADAPPILKWDREGARNPVAWYVHARPSSAGTWGLSAGTWAEVEAVVPMPTMWGDPPMPFVSDGVVLVLRDMKDISSSGRGNAIFPEHLHAELHGVRATVEAYSKAASLGYPEGAACGYDVRNNNAVSHELRAAADCGLRVFSGGMWSACRIDRWD